MPVEFNIWGDGTNEPILLTPAQRKALKMEGASASIVISTFPPGHLAFPNDIDMAERRDIAALEDMRRVTAEAADRYAARMAINNAE